MADELEELWKKPTVTKEEEEDIILGSNNTKVAKEAGKNCIVMKVLTQRSVNVEASKKNMRMLWKPKFRRLRTTYTLLSLEIVVTRKK